MGKEKRGREGGREEGETIDGRRYLHRPPPPQWPKSILPTRRSSDDSDAIDKVMQVSKTYLAERGEEAKWSHVTLISRVELTFEGSNLSGKVSEQKEGDSETSSSCKKLLRQSSTTTTTTSLKLPRTSKLEHLASPSLSSSAVPLSLRREGRN